METTLKERLWEYIALHNPELKFELQEEYRVSAYLEEKIAEVMPEANYLSSNGMDVVTVAEICMERLTEELKPSKFLYVKRILEDEFPIAYDALQQSYLLNYEVLNILESCREIFERFGFNENTGIQRTLRYAIMNEINHYLS
ncbi:hypothetical protein [Pedobacter sp.]